MACKALWLTMITSNRRIRIWSVARQWPVQFPRPGALSRRDRILWRCSGRTGPTCRCPWTWSSACACRADTAWLYAPTGRRNRAGRTWSQSAPCRRHRTYPPAWGSTSASGRARSASRPSWDDRGARTASWRTSRSVQIGWYTNPRRRTTVGQSSNITQ